MGTRRHGGRLLVRLSGVRRRQSLDRPHDGSLWSACGHGTRRRADGGRLAAGAADDAAVASVFDDRCHGRLRKRLSRLLRSIPVSAQLVQSPARPGDGPCIRRRWYRLHHPAAMGAAHDRADRLASRLHRDRYCGSGGAGADQPVAAQAAGGHRASAGWRRCTFGVREAGILYRRSRLGRHRLDLGPRSSHGTVLVARARLFLRIVYLVRGAGSPDQIPSGHRLQCERRGLGPRRGQPARYSRPDRARTSLRSAGREWIWTASCMGFVICFAALIALAQIPSLMLVYVMVLAQGVLGYGLTSILGAVVVEIFQGKHYGSIFGSVMLAALAGGAAGPWLTGFLHDLWGNYTIAFAIGSAVSGLSAFAIWMASPGKIRAVAGQLHRTRQTEYNLERSP